LIELWQACNSGKYNHPDDTNVATADHNFQYWGKCCSGSNGEYIFKTIIPGSYKAAENWIRPPHLHFRIAKRGYYELITQMYFEGCELNSTDKILLDTPTELRKNLIVKLSAPTSNMEPESKICYFNLVITKPG
jgi:protocatechuate 3,4-dioxygenase beta subunit